MQRCQRLVSILLALVIMSNGLLCTIWSGMVHEGAIFFSKESSLCAALDTRAFASVQHFGVNTDPPPFIYNETHPTLPVDDRGRELRKEGNRSSRKKSRSKKQEKERVFVPLVITQNGSRVYQAKLLC